MAVESEGVFDSGFFKAAADLSTHQYKLVEITGADQVNLANAVTDRVIGVLQNKPKSGEAAQIRHLGVSKVVSDGSGTAIAAGDYVGPSAAGLAIKKITANNIVIGIALDASTASGTIIRVLMVPLNWFETAA